jgi:hypothetical protein
MRKSVCLIITLVCVYIAAAPQNTSTAAPLTPAITIEIEPRVMRPAQAGYIFVTGRQSLDVSAELDGEPVPMFWAGHGYKGFVAFGFDAEPGPRDLRLAVTDPLTGETTTFDETVEVANYSYPLEQIPIPFAQTPLLAPELNEAENDQLEAVFEQVTTPDTFDWPFDAPVPFGIITSRFGGDRVYNAGVWRQYHTGADFRRSVGEPIYAAADGRIAATLPMEIYGGVIIVDHGYGVHTLYAHTSEWYLAPGDPVQQGQLLAAAGATGRTNGPHLHWEVIISGVKVDPIAWLALDPGYVPLREANPNE